MVLVGTAVRHVRARGSSVVEGGRTRHRTRRSIIARRGAYTGSTVSSVTPDSAGLGRRNVPFTDGNDSFIVTMSGRERTRTEVYP
ncbi:hypothetical protein C488_03710 [Natrinema pellirubrum DSM 15624]|uniref:Uncharacterized protein n=1 Tax=Natrinema pellirubrum (strain DSM 15624 / CIP 106293 / JCM 10476 / NCIMB 786 / 157) TaxID=797303 RepID=L9Z3C1_NATP1|nr:hypothetical protein C488_03710 [Natrinema pellirubrum DSM 15624]